MMSQMSTNLVKLSNLPHQANYEANESSDSQNSDGFQPIFFENPAILLSKSMKYIEIPGFMADEPINPGKSSNPQGDFFRSYASYGPGGSPHGAAHEFADAHAGGHRLRGMLMLSHSEWWERMMGKNTYVSCGEHNNFKKPRFGNVFF